MSIKFNKESFKYNIVPNYASLKSKINKITILNTMRFVEKYCIKQESKLAFFNKYKTQILIYNSHLMILDFGVLT